MNQEPVELITVEALLDKTRAMREQGRRLVQISATRLPDTVELTYSFDLECQLRNFRLSIQPDSHLPSISSIYGCSVLYENEIHDLFGVQVDGIAVDFKGNFYTTSVPFPFGAGMPAVPPPQPPVPAPPAGPSTF